MLSASLMADPTSPGFARQVPSPTIGMRWPVWRVSVLEREVGVGMGVAMGAADAVGVAGGVGVAVADRAVEWSARESEERIGSESRTTRYGMACMVTRCRSV